MLYFGFPKKSLFVILIFLSIPLGIGCAPERRILQGNVFSTTQPTFFLKLDNSFVYKGTFSKTEGITTSSQKTGHRKSEYHAWYDKEENRHVIVVFRKILTHGWRWLPGKEIAPNKNYVFEIRDERIGGTIWKTAYYAGDPDQYEYDEFRKLGIEYTGSYFSKFWVRNVSEQIQIRVVYSENVDQYDSIKKDVIERGEIYTSREKDLVDIFNKRANKAVSLSNTSA